MKGSLVSVEWLFNKINAPEVVILDATITKVTKEKISDKTGIIPNSIYFDLKHTFLNKLSPFPNTVPSQNDFECLVQNLGINNNDLIVVYDAHGIYSSPRVWWLFKLMGHEHVFVLNGGLPAWKAKGYSNEGSYISKSKIGNFKSKIRFQQLTRYEQIVANLASKRFVIIDARSEERFQGKAKEPRPTLKSGNIPNSFNIPYSAVLDKGKMKSISDLNHVFRLFKNENRTLVFSCGSGITACIVLLASTLVLKNKKSIYDGSWTEWATNQKLTLTSLKPGNLE